MTNKQNLLEIIIKEHIATGVPVGSNILVDKYNLNISPATARQRMVALENEGLIFQPHTSAGRVPTQKAYNCYIKKLKTKKLSSALENEFTEILSQQETEQEMVFKKLAKKVAQESNLAIFWAFHKHNLYYTGIANLLAQPEFAQLNKVYDVSNIIDEIDEIIDNIYNEINIGTHILIGEDNPFGDFLSTILAKYKANSQEGMFGIIAPMRMDYQANLSLVDYIFQKINKN